MKCFSRLNLIGFALFFILFPVPLFAYIDHIAAPLEEVWKASEEVLKPHGIHQISQEKGTMESKWIQTRVTREKRILGKTLAKDYWQRYRLKVSIKETQYSVQVEVRGTYQFRPVDSPWHASWFKMKLKGEDREKERDFFFKILSRLEQNKQNPTASTPA
ncbi:MAG: hypothetical protein HYZ83_02740 [Candidatus Omnitrophica bacterium]|nr:hypothetical protein [Candidatus Omnitrophota bacterium]